MGRCITILGSTGSIGRQTLEAVKGLGPDWRVAALAAHSNHELLARQIRAFGCRRAAVMDAGAYERLRAETGPKCHIMQGPEALIELATLPEVDTVVVAVVGTAGIGPTLAALRAGKRVALANKETLVAAGQIVLDVAKQGLGEIIPVDSEHSAIFQCLAGQPRASLERLTLTASGGPFRQFSAEALEKVTADMALKHPTWEMGAKVTIDSATLMNKGLEVIEAHWLFGVDYDKIDVAVHPASVVHSMIHMADGSILAQLGPADMRLPIQYALTYPERRPNTFSRLNLFELGALVFERPDLRRFPSLGLAYEAGRCGGTMPAVLNAADEVAVAAFRQGRIGFMDVPRIVAETLGKHINGPALDVGTIMAADSSARLMAHRLIRDWEGR